MEQSRAGRAVALVPALGLVFALIAAILALSLIPPLRQSSLALIASIASPLWIVTLLLPLAAGCFLLVSGRRFWAWPFVYLTALFVAFSGLLSSSDDNTVDLAFEYARITLLSITVLVAELVGLSAGRLFHRLAAVAYFAGAALWLFVTAIGRADGASPLQWKCAVLLTATLGFMLQAAIQLGKYLKRQKALRMGWYKPDEDEAQYSEGWDDDEDYIAPPEPAPTINADALPWKVVIGDEGAALPPGGPAADKSTPATDGWPEKG